MRYTPLDIARLFDISPEESFLGCFEGHDGIRAKTKCHDWENKE